MLSPGGTCLQHSVVPLPERGLPRPAERSCLFLSRDAHAQEFSLRSIVLAKKPVKENTIKMLQRTFPNVSLKEFVGSQEVLVPQQTPTPVVSFLLLIFSRFYWYLSKSKVSYKRERASLANGFSSAARKGSFSVFYQQVTVFGVVFFTQKKELRTSVFLWDKKKINKIKRLSDKCLGKIQTMPCHPKRNRGVLAVREAPRQLRVPQPAQQRRSRPSHRDSSDPARETRASTGALPGPRRRRRAARAHAVPHHSCVAPRFSGTPSSSPTASQLVIRTARPRRSSGSQECPGTSSEPLGRTASGRCACQSVTLAPATGFALSGSVRREDTRSPGTGLKAVEFSSLPIKPCSTTNDIFWG